MLFASIDIKLIFFLFFIYGIQVEIIEDLQQYIEEHPSNLDPQLCSQKLLQVWFVIAGLLFSFRDIF